MIDPWLKKYLTNEGLKKIEQSIISAEKKTSGEIVPMIVRRSSTIGHVPIMLFTIFLLLFYVSGVYDFSHDFFSESWLITLAWSVLSIFISLLLSKSPKIQRMFVNSIDRDSQSRSRALNEFYQAGLDKTEASTGILLFISLDDHEAVVLADKSISDQLPPETWKEVVQLLLKGAKHKDLAEGFCLAINKCAEILEKNFPILPDDVDELPNQLIIKE